MNFKKRVNGSWTNTPHYIHNTSTDTITTLPAVLYPNDTTATVGLKGQAVQSSVPSPTSPVMPQGCGNKTANLFDSSSISLVPVSTSATRSGTNLGILPQGDYVLSATATTGATQLYRMIKDGNNYTFETIRELPYTFTADGTSEQIIRTSGSNFTSWASTGYTNIMLNTGSTALPFEPFGVKIPISSANTTTPVYLGEVETTRKIKKLVLTGESNINKNTPSKPNDYLYYLSGVQHEKTDCICSHLISTNSFPIAAIGGVYSKYSSGIIYINMSRGVMEAQPSGNTVEGFKEYLAAQYAAGTPVTVWYVLANEETGIVNEPLMKIGTYADSLTTSIPCTAGSNSFDVDTTVQPSEVTATYEGWHPVQSAHEYGGGGTNLFDAEAAYGEMYNDGVVSGTPQDIHAVKNYFTSDEIGKQLTISVYAESVTSNRAEMFVFINGVRTTSNSISRGQQGTMTFTVIPTSTSDNWTITYGSGGDINSFSNLTVTEEPHWD